MPDASVHSVSLCISGHQWLRYLLMWSECSEFHGNAFQFKRKFQFPLNARVLDFTKSHFNSSNLKLVAALCFTVK